jgi:hypothetical protein
MTCDIVIALNRLGVATGREPGIVDAEAREYK